MLSFAHVKKNEVTKRNPSVTGGYSLWTKVRRKGKGPPWPGGPGGPLGTMRRWFLRGWGGGQGLPASSGGNKL